MAMMMTGRVLLVCALCVLWCGAGGRCEEEVVPVAEITVDSASGGVVTDKEIDRTVTGGAGNPSVEKTQPQNVEDSAPGSPQSQAGSDIELTKQQPHTDQKNTDPPPHSKSLQEERRDGTSENSPGESATSLSQGDTKHASIESPERNNPPTVSSNDDVVSRKSEERTEDNSGSTETHVAAPSEEGQERENVTSSLEQPRETSTAAPNVTTQTTSMTPPKDSESSSVKMSEASPQSTGTANTNQTATITQNSDGSTAASHTTSPPLLLLVVVVCAAAAAVAA
ncbi:Mucin-associated surface protein (MASP) [Trypanosoma cruzi]|uniref:Mucin-associated surface protein (MASP), putative n=2 Tax=Trypanosoma cruzi TaxID=5693 RepID=Q4E4Z3_TRYCC|nr:mucin-associated surface protein (MASP), putative [Trypanosoma cruzi]EAN99820.1 mucin-associated surface protein (MASP), putative [Trypanosoma cruzi]PWV21341.1 Mucin-associated surface protein (MASP) [Trypanosoma cruzi]RNC38589.1 mucin-associated surface protein (MASP) [Trypanosoma cruzi]|eukprot:XP_821671.1 mucin-associated surface protein (MASP) [Trypanosoma cruzi strain CL Brener]